MDQETLNRSSRLAGLVKRYHAFPTLQTQTVGEHTWQAMRIYYSIWGPLPADVSTHMLWHDCGELVTGDIPHKAKKISPIFKMHLQQLEDETVHDMGGPSANEAKLSAQEAWRVKMCDLIEMLEFGLMEVAFSNPFAFVIVKNCQEALEKMRIDYDDSSDIIKVTEYLNKVYAFAHSSGILGFTPVGN